MKTEKKLYIEPQTIIVEGNNDAVLMAGSGSAGEVNQDDDSRHAKSFQPIGDEDLIGNWEDESQNWNASSSPEKSRGW